MIMHQSLGSHRRPWSEEDDAELRRRCEAGEFLIDIARAVGRTQEACRSRANTLGVACRSSLRGQRSRVRQPVPTA
ncbi:MAG: hypothetical protein JWM38_2040 [Sphingomonas bacterium]|jgi:methyl coenzyme M reductase subunit C-like uncharacterized protein (methanogenesis marker protein 7)|nr:hypothetical protein [Sphingomonas bacterium]MDB5718613.1 hypothetical protein [Sphingomonas bacterium]